MESLRQYFLAGSGFSEQQDGRIRRCHGFHKVNHFGEGRRGADYQAQIAAGFDFFREVFIFASQLLAELFDLW